MVDIAERLRMYVSGPHERGDKYTTVYNLDGRLLLDAADKIERLRAGYAEAICHLTPYQCHLVNEAVRAVAEDMNRPRLGPQHDRAEKK